jgi:hypothetical protein
MIVYEQLDLVADRKRSEQVRSDNEERYRRITLAMTDYIYTAYVKKGNVVDTVHSEVCEVVTGYKDSFCRG